MKKILPLISLLVLTWVALPAKATNFGLVEEMYRNGELSQKEYLFKRNKAAPKISVEEQAKRMRELRTYKGKSHGMRFVYTQSTLKDIDDLFDIDEEICEYDAEKYIKQLQRAKGAFSKKLVYQQRFLRCMRIAGWRKLP